MALDNQKKDKQHANKWFQTLVYNDYLCSVETSISPLTPIPLKRSVAMTVKHPYCYSTSVQLHNTGQWPQLTLLTISKSLWLFPEKHLPGEVQSHETRWHIHCNLATQRQNMWHEYQFHDYLHNTILHSRPILSHDKIFSTYRVVHGIVWHCCCQVFP